MEYSFLFHSLNVKQNTIKNFTLVVVLDKDPIAHLTTMPNFVLGPLLFPTRMTRTRALNKN